MKKYIPFYAMLFLVVTGCASVVQEEEVVSVEQQGTRIVQAIIAENYKEFIAGANDASAGGNDAESFLASCKQLENTYGTPGAFRYLGQLQTPLLVNQLYAIKFKRKGENNKIIEHEQLLQLIFGQDNGKYKLLGMRFM